MSWAKDDGAYIKITFDKGLLGEVSGNQSHFTVTAKEYNYVPNGNIQSVVKTVLSTGAGSTEKEIVLTMSDTTRFESSTELTVIYDGLGTLAGSTGNVEAFSQTFVPQGLVPKPDQMDAEHLEMTGISIATTLTKIYTTDVQNGGEHIEITSVTLIGTITHINDL